MSSEGGRNEMRKRKRTTAFWGVLALACLLGPPAAAYEDGVYQDLAPGFHDDAIVTVTIRGGRIVDLDARNRNGNENEYFYKALEGIRQGVLQRQGTEGVDAVSGATGASSTLLEAVGGALEQARAETPETAPETGTEEAEAFTGLGVAAKVPDPSGASSTIRIAAVQALFDREGRMLSATADVYELPGDGEEDLRLLETLSPQELEKLRSEADANLKDDYDLLLVALEKAYAARVPCASVSVR